MKFSSLAAMEIVKIKLSMQPVVKKIVKMTTFSFKHWREYGLFTKYGSGIHIVTKAL